MCFALSIYTSCELIQSWSMSIDKQQEFPMIGLASEPVFQGGISLSILPFICNILVLKGERIQCFMFVTLQI